MNGRKNEKRKEGEIAFLHFDIDEEVRWHLERILGIRKEVKKCGDDERFARAMLEGLKRELGWFLDNGVEEGGLVEMGDLSLR